MSVDIFHSIELMQFQAAPIEEKYFHFYEK